MSRSSSAFEKLTKAQDVRHTEFRTSTTPETATSIDQWTASLLRDVKRATKTTPEDAPCDTQNGGNSDTVQPLHHHVYQTTRLISRIANKHHGMKEANLIRLVTAFSMSRILYVAPFMKLTLADKKKLNTLIKRCYKCALHLPISMLNAKLDGLGLHNTTDELIEAQRISHYERLSQTPTARHVLCALGITYVSQFGEKIPIPPDIRETIVIPPIPRNMYPEHNTERRVERAKQLAKRYAQSTDVAYVDAAEYPTHRAMVLAVATGPEHTIVWASGHLGLAGNENAHDAARALVYRARQSTERDSSQADTADGERMVSSFREHARDRMITFK
ncbi:hypothetical protein HPB50_006791 [Hyalomma asiaticum]|uniref:Uncharacterized protein n=1 Tax=Hyalomma asiaticum TaxID=266040 RepID=A0ACB7RJE2_HYAAI|nr:hypothetical protein HPB50_006791 [Hyalomma asiaticum]